MGFQKDYIEKELTSRQSQSHSVEPNQSLVINQDNSIAIWAGQLHRNDITKIKLYLYYMYLIIPTVNYSYK